MGEVPTAEDKRSPPLLQVPFTQWEVRKKIRKLRSDAAASPDKIGPRLLQELENELVGPLTWIFKTSLRTGDVPDDWRRANVTPIFKKGAKADPGNYRPVSLTPVCCKLLESLIRDKLMDHLLENKLINQSQHGFMSKKSCTTNLLEFMELVTKAVDEGDPVDVVYLDFAKAFDTVPKERLLEKLRAHGVRGEVLEWIRAWLTDRTQRVVLNGSTSTWKEVLSGVPQGSVLGPILFLIFINDLDFVERLIALLRKFADDTKLGQRVKTQEQAQLLQRALDELCEWADTWGMRFNVKKCKVMHFGHNNPRHNYTMMGQNLEEIQEEVDIGVKICANLKSSEQCRKAVRTAQTVLSQICRAFHYRDKYTFVKLYKQYVLPHLEFAVPVWSPWQDGDKELLERVQKRAISQISGLRGATYEEKLRELDMDTLEERRHQIDMLQTYKILKGVDKVEKETWFDMAADGARHTRMTADPNNLKIPAARLDVRKHFFSQRVPEQWNKIPASLKQAKSASAFRFGYRAHRREVTAAARYGAMKTGPES